MRLIQLRDFLKVLFLGVIFVTAQAHAFTALYVFGDSLSDTGNTPAPTQGYYNGRYCNGPLWVEYLSAQLGITYNASNNFAESGSITSDLASQVAELPASTNLQSGLFTVWSAGNDFLDASEELGVNDTAWAAVVTNAVFNITNAVHALYVNGAREIIVGNLPNLGLTPAFNSGPMGFGSYVDTKVATFNASLASATATLMQKNSGLRIYLLDNNAGLTRILATPAILGFTVTTNGALEDPNLTDKSFTGPGANYVFWDIIHPTTKVNMRTANDAIALIGVQTSLVHTGTNYSLTVSNLYPGFGYTLQTSTNLSAWSTTTNFTAASTNASFSLTNSSSKATYYRVGY